MKTLTYTNARSRLAKTMEQVCSDHDPVLVTRSHHAPVVILSLEDYESLNETTYLLKSPKNSSRLLASIEELKKGEGRERNLIE